MKPSYRLPLSCCGFISLCSCIIMFLLFHMMMMMYGFFFSLSFQVIHVKPNWSSLKVLEIAIGANPRLSVACSSSSSLARTPQGHKGDQWGSLGCFSYAQSPESSSNYDST